jgi:hypothetical protein
VLSAIRFRLSHRAFDGHNKRLAERALPHMVEFDD